MRRKRSRQLATEQERKVALADEQALTLITQTLAQSAGNCGQLLLCVAGHCRVIGTVCNDDTGQQSGLIEESNT